jgi:hypothetical protein
MGKEQEISRLRRNDKKQHAAYFHPCNPIRGSSLPYEKTNPSPEHSFPPAFVDRVNTKTGGRTFRPSSFASTKSSSEPCGYDVIIDRISQDVPFYRAFRMPRSPAPLS